MASPQYQISALSDLSLESVNKMIGQMNRALEDINKKPGEEEKKEEPFIINRQIDVPVTEIIFTDLSLKRNMVYDFYARFKNDTASNAQISLFINDDLTETNYHSAGVGTGGVGSPVQGNASDATFGTLAGSGQEVENSGKLIIDGNGMVSLIYLSSRGNNDNYMWMRHLLYDNSVDEIHSIKLTSSVASGIGIDSYFKLWKAL